MPRNGSGQYSAPTNSWNPAINGVPATAADWQAVLNDIVSALTQSVSRDGQTAMTGNLPMAGNKVTGLGNATATGDALTFAQLFSQGQQQDVPAAATTDIGAQLSTIINVTGAATITSFGTNYNGPRFLRFAGVCTLTNSATLVLPGGANITTAAGDSCIAVPLGNPATGWRVAGMGNVLTTGDQTIGGTKTFSSQIVGSTNSQVSLTGDQTIGGTKTFSSQIVASGGVQGNVTGNAGTVTNGVYTTGDQTIGGVKTFSSAPLSTANGATGGYGFTAAGGAHGRIYGMPADDGASATVANVRISSWFGIGFSPSVSGMPVPQNENAVWIDTRTGNLSARGNVNAASYNGGQLAGFRNLLINGNFQINQRGYASGTNVGAANTYTLDRWRVVTSGQNVTFTASGNGNQITAPAGGIEQVIEGINIGGGTYVLNWTGTATATVNGTARAKGESFTLPANTNATVRLIGGTASQVQLEPGTVATPFEHRPIGAELALCQRYCYVPANVPTFSLAWVAGSTLLIGHGLPHPVQMRAAPNITGVTGFTIQGVTASATGFTFAGSNVSYLTLGSNSQNGLADGLLRSCNPNQIPVISAEL